MKNKVREILDWYEGNKRVLPWRKIGISAYEVWVSEIMLQQTQVPRVVDFYTRFLKRFPTVQKLAKASWEDFLPYYEGLGYYSRGRNMLETARIVVRDLGGEFPTEKHAMMKLPGVGEYTASAVLSFAYDQPHVAFDTNFKKIFGTRENAEKALRESNVPSSVFNSAVMDYSSALPRKPKSKKQISKRRDRKPTVVILHENHKIYFSANKRTFEPFALPDGASSRAAVKKYFLDMHGLRVSVRPPDKDGFVNAQILSGKPPFVSFAKKDYTSWYETAKN